MRQKNCLTAIGRICPRPRRFVGKWLSTDGIHSQPLLHDRDAADPARHPVSHGSFVRLERTGHPHADQAQQKRAGRGQQSVPFDHPVHAGLTQSKEASRATTLVGFGDGCCGGRDQFACDCHASQWLTSRGIDNDPQWTWDLIQSNGLNVLSS
jgi:hypothetical protein